MEYAVFYNDKFMVDDDKLFLYTTVKDIMTPPDVMLLDREDTKITITGKYKTITYLLDSSAFLVKRQLEMPLRKLGLYETVDPDYRILAFYYIPEEIKEFSLDDRTAMFFCDSTLKWRPVILNV